jgi:folate-dependent phosphoribosylglycinamide formyltransferase PurN
MEKRIVLLAGVDPVSRIVYHALAREFPIAAVILEDRVPRSQLIRRRLKTLGLATVAGQVLFMALALPWLRRTGARRIEALMREHGLDDSPIPGPIVQVASVNSDEARDAIRQAEPDVVVVNGTRIISPETLAATSAQFLNMHAGITPLYRGVHGAYWALCERRPDLAGTTVHLVNKGIDTGAVIGQATFPVAREDSFATYPCLHTASGLPLLIDAVRQALEGKLTTSKNPKKLPSRLRSHPTLWGYLARRARLGVR